jgi:hypothetical protein
LFLIILMEWIFLEKLLANGTLWTEADLMM